MTTLAHGPRTHASAASNLSLVLRGPLFQLFRRVHLAGDGIELLRRRVVVIALVAWLPLLILSLAQSLAAGDAVAVPYLLDVDFHVRFWSPFRS